MTMIAVKGMEMPKSCALCERFEGTCKYTDFGDYQTKRNPSCPLVEIVTCKDCKFNDNNTCTIDGFGVADDYFCAGGKRREK
jgi:hypothetical protein